MSVHRIIITYFSTEKIAIFKEVEFFSHFFPGSKKLNEHHRSSTGIPMSADDERHYTKYSDELTSDLADQDAPSGDNNGYMTTKQKLQLAARSLSLEISKHKNSKLTSSLSNQLISSLLTR